MHFTRRSFIKVSSMAGAFWVSHFPRQLLGAVPNIPEPSCLVHSSSNYAPFIEAFLKQIRPGADEFVAETYAFELEELLHAWSKVLLENTQGQHSLSAWIADKLHGASLDRPNLQSLRSKEPIQTEKATFTSPAPMNREQFLSGVTRYFSAWTRLDVAEMQIDMIDILSEAPLRIRTHVHYDFAGKVDRNRCEERTGEWTLLWERSDEGRWSIREWSAEGEMRSRLTGPGFVDVSASALGSNVSYRKQLLFGIDHWRAVLDGASGIDVYGNNGISVGDYNGDGLDDIYVCQPAGLPNLLYKNLGNGTFIDVTEQAGVGVLDGTSCAIFADLTNSGRQDLIVVRNSGPLLFANRGDGTFELKPDAFQFANPPQGTFTGASVADYNRDGLLDIYFCTYSFYQGLSDYEYPKPYYDAQNGPPNYLLQNTGNYRFKDVTLPSGLNISNNRFSFDAVWNDYDRDGWQDLYVVNDFGRKVLYHNNRDGTFTDVSAELGVEDPGEGMSMTWFDYDNDGRDDMYLVNMWESAGRRVTSQSQFMPSAPETVRKTFHRDAMGNILLRNDEASGKFLDVTEESGTRFGGWNWGSEAWDFDHDGYPDLYVANGFISGENKEDLSSFYWRHIAARSLDTGSKAKSYADAWSAINEFIRSGYTWSGYQRNNFYLNNRNSTFAESAALLGIDCIEDSRSFALSDLDGDGRLEVVLKNRTAPQVRIFHNHINPLGQAIIFSLQGVRSNRDGIGAVIEVETDHGKQSKTLRAGSGFLSQNTKALHFGLGDNPGRVRATVTWPSGAKQSFNNLPSGHKIEVVEGSESYRSFPFSISRFSQHAEEEVTSEASDDQGIWLLDPILPPDPTLTDSSGTNRSLFEAKGSLQLLAFVSTRCGKSVDFLMELERGNAAWKKAGVVVTAVVFEAQNDHGQLSFRPSYRVLNADAKAFHIFSLFRRYLFDKRQEMHIPSAFLLDAEGKVVCIYNSPARTAEILADAGRIPRNATERLNRALPFAGHYYRTELHHNYFTYGVAYLQHDYMEEARAAFEQSIGHGQSNPAAYYNLGLIYLNKNQLPEAKRYLEKAAEMDPSNADAWNNLGVVAGQQGDYESAQRNFLLALERQPTHLLALQNMVKLLRFQEKSQEARALLLKAIAVDPHQAELHRGLGVLYLQEQNLESARAEFEKAVELEPSNVELLNGLGIVLMQMAESEKAMRLFEKCMRIAPSFEGAYLNIAMLYLAAGKADKAHDVLSEFLTRAPQNDTIRKALQEVDSRR